MSLPRAVLGLLLPALVAGSLALGAGPAPAADDPVTPGITPAPTVGTAASSTPAKATRDPRRTRGLFVDPYMPAAQAGREFARIGGKAQALWITDYYRTPARAKAAVADYTRRALEAKKIPVMAIYAIPGRDCGLASEGGLANGAAYKNWIRAVAAGMKGKRAMVVLEPDAVPFMGDPRCVDSAPRQKLLTFAAQKLKQSGAWVYIDAGHSDWRTPAQMAGLLKKSGMRYARGFTTNVGNFRRTPAEHAYAKKLVRELAKRGLSGRKYLIETARNGAAKPVDGDVCNPTWARLGAAPRLRFDGAFDGTIWIKHPGESDGDRHDDQQDCHGGPSSGAWWPEGARLLMGR